MRVLLNQCYFLPELQAGRYLEGCPHEIIAIGSNYHHSSRLNSNLNFKCLKDDLPSDWWPDIYIHWSPEYNPVPVGIEELQCFKVVVVGDWYLAGQILSHIESEFDLCFASEAGCINLRKLGIEPVEHALLWAYNPSLHQRIPEMVRDLDISFAGNFNHDVQITRERWLARIARLSSRYRVRVDTGVYGEGYNRLLNRSKIAFNRSITGELNMRSYEAAACGALLFIEESNAEVTQVLSPGDECILYNENNFEDLVDYYLSHEEERQRIADAGYRKIQGHTYAQHLADIVSIAEKYMQMDRKPRKFVDIPVGVRHTNLAMQWALGQNTTTADRASQLLEKAARLRPHDFRVWLALAHQRVSKWQDNPKSASASVWLTEARNSALKALRLYPESVNGRCALAYLASLSEDLIAAESELIAALYLMDNPDFHLDQLSGPLIDRKFDEFNTKWEMLNASLPKSDPDFLPKAKSLFRWRILTDLYDVAWKQKRFSKALSFAREAVGLEPTSGKSHYMLARAQRALGLSDKAVSSYRKALEFIPLHPEVWIETINLLFTLGRHAECLAAWDELVKIINGCPPLEPLKDLLADTIHRSRELVSSGGQDQNQKAIAPDRHRFIVISDLSAPESWQPVITAFARRFGPSDRIDLLLRFENSGRTPTHVLLEKIDRYISDELHLSTDNIANIIIIAEEMSPDDYWKVIRVADTFIGDHSTFGSDIAHAMEIPIIPAEDLLIYQIPQRLKDAA